jgi:tight adherence protein C
MTLIAIAALALVGLGVALGLRALLLPRIKVAERMGQVEVYGYVADAPTSGSGDREDPSGLAAIAARVGFALLQRYPERFDEDEIRQQLTAAGMYGMAPLVFLGARGLAAIGMPTAILALGTLGGAPVAMLLFGAIVAALLGWRVPTIVLERRAKSRLVQIDRDMPELVDLLIVSVEAGVGFNASMQLAGARATGPLGDELSLALQEQRMGLSTSESLEKMMGRVDTPSMRSFVRSILQGEQLGVSIGQILRNLASEMRKRRHAAAEERAQKAPIKMLFQLVFLIFPALFIVLLYPAMHEIGKAFG